MTYLEAFLSKRADSVDGTDWYSFRNHPASPVEAAQAAARLRDSRDRKRPNFSYAPADLQANVVNEDRESRQAESSPSLAMEGRNMPSGNPSEARVSRDAADSSGMERDPIVFGQSTDSMGSATDTFGKAHGHHDRSRGPKDWGNVLKKACEAGYINGYMEKSALGKLKGLPSQLTQLWYQKDMPQSEEKFNDLMRLSPQEAYHYIRGRLLDLYKIKSLKDIIKIERLKI